MLSSGKSYSHRLLANFMQALSPLGPVFDDPSVNEIMINGPHDVFLRQSGPDKKFDVDLGADHIQTAITLLASIAKKQIGGELLILSARLPGFRVEACLPPVAVKGPSMCVRRHATKIITLEDYAASATISEAQAEVIRKMVVERKNFLIAGGTFSGKTTLMNCVLSLVDPLQRLFIIEQVQELRIVSPNHVLVECDPEQGVTARRAVQMGMRYSPDRIFLGELRGPEAYDWLDASNTGHPGSGATIHADGAPDALERLESLVLTADTGMPHDIVRQRIASTVDYVLFIEQAHGKRRLSQICHVEGFDRQRGEYRIKDLSTGE